MLKKVLIGILVLVVLGVAGFLALAVLVLKDTKNNMASLGDTVENFSVTTTDGRTLTLDELLKEKDCVVVNVFTTWCGPCKAEFPEMEKAYEKDHARYELVARIWRHLPIRPPLSLTGTGRWASGRREPSRVRRSLRRS